MSTLSVVIVDDEPSVCDALRVSLGRKKFFVRTASDLTSALNLIAEQAPNVVLLDVKLGNEDGLRLLTLLEDRQLDVPCVAFTGRADASDGFKAHQLGVRELIEKPSSPDRLAVALRRAAETPPSDELPTLLRRNTTTVPMVGPVRDRIAIAIVRLVASDSDLKTLRVWARNVGVAEGTFKGWCRICQIHPTDVLMFGRLLRAVTNKVNVGAPWMDSLELLDIRTARRWFARAFESGEQDLELPKTAAEFLRVQRLILDKGLIQRVASGASVAHAAYPTRSR